MAVLCARQGGDDEDPCPNDATKVCSHCHLVAYCSSTCQRRSWKSHKRICKSDLSLPFWLPDWAREERPPSFLGQDEHDKYLMADLLSKYVWGNVPALDIVQLSSNEGTDYAGDLAVLFAASGDFRCALKTLAALPQSFKGAFTLAINDREPDIVFRNVISMLLLTSDHPLSIDTLIHVWYSARLRPDHVALLDSVVKPLVHDVVNKTHGAHEDRLLSKTVKSGTSHLRIILTRGQWCYMHKRLSTPMDSDQAHANRYRVLNARKDHLHRIYTAITSDCHRRLAMEKFRDRGILLPYGSPDEAFTIPNFTLYDAKGTWLAREFADPQEGWDPTDRTTHSHPTHLPGLTNDTYGQLHHMLHTLTHLAETSLLSRPTTIVLSCTDATALRTTHPTTKFDRLDVSNASDAGYLGTSRTLLLARDLLNRTNPHATLLTLYLNAIPNTVTAEQTIATAALGPAVLKLLPELGRNMMQLVVFTEFAGKCALPFDEIWETYTQRIRFGEAARQAGMRVKEGHTLVEKWPYRVRFEAGDPVVMEGFWRRLGSGLSGCERYVEWRVDA
ncbi:hypothetical protein BDZ85DRAFT_306527 [Elsinoe ampelina]|uniref:MYND-type domain-containing protein n=1 Tax=Elsinoe ampelina TaxID=302913 RepID=A0A6A6GNI1_9PEZI|nr:hypothetical protein BDZ85DRAFT_306527 [Elsinoe ampelina]